MKGALLIMAKRPLPGRTKTRLCPPFTPAEAADLYECFLQDTIALVQAVPAVDHYIAAAPPPETAYFSRLAPDFGLLEQQGPTLSDRLDFVMRHCSEVGYAQVVAINSDSPTLPSEFLSQAFAQLGQEGTDVVLGPSEDGGYYLIGWKEPNSRLVRQVQMSTPHVLQDTLHVAGQESLRVSVLPTWYDVDDVFHLQRLQTDLAASPHYGRFTREFLASIPRASEVLNISPEKGLS